MMSLYYVKLPESFSSLFSFANKGYFFLNLSGIDKFKQENINEMISGSVPEGKCRQRENGIFSLRHSYSSERILKQAPVVQTLHSTVHLINHYAVDRD